MNFLIKNIMLTKEQKATQLALAEIRPHIEPAIDAIENLHRIGFPQEIAPELEELRKSVHQLNSVAVESYDSNTRESIGSAAAMATGAAVSAIVTTVAASSVAAAASAAAAIAAAPVVVLLGGYWIYKSRSNLTEEAAKNAVKDVVINAENVKSEVIRHPKFENKEFKCISDNAKCMQKYGSKSKIYTGLCALAFATCIAKSLIPFAGRH